MKCILCQTHSVHEIPLSAEESEVIGSLAFSGVLWRCQQCELIFKDPQYFLNYSEQKTRYDHHRNSIDDPGYVQTFMPILSATKELIDEKHGLQNADFLVLDWGAGPVPVLSQLFKQKMNLQIDIYDPVYSPQLPQRKYDLITCTEVVEHMTDPLAELQKMDQYLNSGGVLLGMTNFYPQNNFRKWWYVRDLTHVIFFCEKTFHWLAEYFAWQVLQLQSPLFELKKK